MVLNAGLSGLSGLSGLIGQSGGGGPTLWTPSNDPDLVLWYESDSYEAGAGSYVVPVAKNNGSNAYKQYPIGTPVDTTDSVQLDTIGGVDCFTYKIRGTKCSQTFSLGDLDIYMVLKITAGDGAYTRYADHDYGNGFWIGSFGAPSFEQLVGGGVRQGGSPYGISSTMPFAFGWNMLQIARTTSDGYYQINFNADINGDYLYGDFGTPGSTMVNPIAIGSELGGNNAVPRLSIAALVIYGSCGAGANVTGTEAPTDKRQGYLHNRFPGHELILNHDHEYYGHAPTV